jgi:hypothetical protein
MNYQYEQLASRLSVVGDCFPMGEPVRCKFCRKVYDLTIVRIVGDYGVHGVTTRNIAFETPCCRQIASSGAHCDFTRLTKGNSIFAR